MLLLSAVLGLVLAAPAVPVTPAVTIYVGPHVRDGFVDADQGVWDSIHDVRKLLKKNKAFAVVPDESGALLKLYVVARAISLPTGDGTTIVVPGAIIGTTQMPGTSFHIATKARHVAALLRVGTYERPFIAEDLKYNMWGRCAEILVDDVSAWLTSNRERLTVAR